MEEYRESVSAYQEVLDMWEDQLDALEYWYNEFLTDNTQTYETVLQETLDRIPELAEQYQDAYRLHNHEIADLKDDLEGSRRKHVVDLDARYGMLKERQKYLSDVADDQFDLPFQGMLDDKAQPGLLQRAKHKYRDMTVEEKIVAGFTPLAVAGLIGEEIRNHLSKQRDQE